jgi:hypothetical protein|tara:strand:+ start:1643 stop:1756 length:114 start_codon:yes stop_codon:yes gene_type:complete
MNEKMQEKIIDVTAVCVWIIIGGAIGYALSLLWYLVL